MQGNKLLLCWRLSRVGIHLIYGCIQVMLFFGVSTRTRRQARIRRWSRQLLSISGVKLTVLPHSHAMPNSAGRMLVANHISWLDIYTINAIAPMRFVAKDDIRRWPVVGWLAARAGTVFIRRGCRTSAQEVNQTLANVLRGGDCVVVFPEGTTTDGNDIKPFKSSLFQAAVHAQATVQPLALRYPGQHGGSNPAAAYYDDITLWQSLCAVLQQRRTEAEIHVLAPIDTSALNRQQICQLAQAQIADCLAQCWVAEGLSAQAWEQLHISDAL